MFKFDKSNYIVTSYCYIFQEIPLCAVPIMATKLNTETSQMSNIGKVISGTTETHHTSFYNEFGQVFRESTLSPMETDNNHKFSGDLYTQDNDMTAFNTHMSFIEESGAYYEDIALPDAFLEDYYSQVTLALRSLQILHLQCLEDVFILTHIQMYNILLRFYVLHWHMVV